LALIANEGARDNNNNNNNEGARNNVAQDMIGWIMLSVDIFVLLASLAALFGMLAGFRTHVKKIKDRLEGTDCVSPTALRHRSRVKVFNTQQSKPVRKFTASMVEAAVRHNKVQVFEKRSEDQRRKRIVGILSRQEIFRRKLALKLDKRRKMKVPTDEHWL
jgi:hypothetical protein